MIHRTAIAISFTAAATILAFLVKHPFVVAGQPNSLNAESPTAEQVEAWIADSSTLSTKLRAVRTLNAEAANVLVANKVRRLRLDGLTSITPEVARILANQSPEKGGIGLSFNGLTAITPEVAEALALGRGGGLSLGGLTTISVEVARELSGVRRKLMLGGLKTLSPEVAAELAKHRSKLTLMGLPAISDEAAEALSVHRGTFLLNGLTRLTSSVLVQNLLSKSDGFVGFKKVETMTDEVASIFVAYDDRKPITLDALTELPPANAAALRANKKIVLPPHLRKPGITNSLGMRLAYIPSGKFGMGSPGDEAHREEQEKRHEVVLTNEFYLGAHEVTVGQFRVFVSESRYVTEASRDGEGSWGITSTGKFERDAKYNWKSPGFEQTDDHPVVDVSWNDAKAFCKWLSEKEKKTYRLPTEAEWEYACRAGTRTAYSFGDDPQDLLTAGNAADATARQAFKAWSLGIKGKDSYAYSAPVGQFKPNRFGLYDMHGNVWEWCEDWYDPTGYSGKRSTDPKGPESGERKVHRGGGWSSASNRCRSASRIGRHHSTYRGCYLGFRVVLE